MHGPDGVDYPNKKKYLEVEEYSRMVYDHGGNDERAPMFRVTVVFSNVTGGTQIKMTMRLPSPEAAESTRKYIKKAGGETNWDRLAEYLEKEMSGKDNFVINGFFAVPVDTLFEVWTNPKHASR